MERRIGIFSTNGGHLVWLGKSSKETDENLIKFLKSHNAFSNA